jgi:Zn-finger nucleic acid-binding protein
MTTPADLDAQWLAQARARVAAGGPWERTPDQIERAAHAVRDSRPAPSTTPLACPYCDDHPPLETLRRYELVTHTPLRFCPGCYGFWAAGDSLARGVADSRTNHPALRAAQAPRRCRACNRHLKPDGLCAKCHQLVPPTNCPECHKPMDRFEQNGISVDACAACRGTWFDMGEITAIFGISQPVDLGRLAVASEAARTEIEDDIDERLGPWMTALNIALTLFRFL